MNDELKERITDGMIIYSKRMNGDKTLWSAMTKCRVCTEWWLYGVQDNLNFICTKCAV